MQMTFPFLCLAALDCLDSIILGRSNQVRGGRAAGVLRMSGLPADFDPLSPSMDHLSLIDEASQGRSQPRVRFIGNLIDGSGAW